MYFNLSGLKYMRIVPKSDLMVSYSCYRRSIREAISDKEPKYIFLSLCEYF